MVREALPKARLLLLAYPVAELGIVRHLPWREEILDGLRLQHVLGFHTPFHRKNFLETVDRYLETRIEPEASTISYGGEMTQVEDYPISIAWPEDNPDQPDVAACRAQIRSELGVTPNHLLGIGVDRLDYTKGIVERFQAVERMLEQQPGMVGNFTFVQIAAPSRASLDEYQSFRRPECARWSSASTRRFGQRQLRAHPAEDGTPWPGLFAALFPRFRGVQCVDERGRRHESGGQGIHRARDERTGRARAVAIHGPPRASCTKR